MSSSGNGFPTGAFFASVFLAIAFALRDALAERIGKELIGFLPLNYLLFGLLFGSIIYLGWRVFACRKTEGAGLTETEKPCYPLIVRLFGLGLMMAGIFAILAGAVKQYQTPGTHLYAWLQLGRASPPKIELRASPEVVSLGKESQLSVWVDGVVGDPNYQATWDAGPDTWYKGPRCEATPYQPAMDLLQPGQGKLIHVTVEVRDAQKRLLGTAETDLQVKYAANLAVQADPPRLFTSESTTLRLLLNGKPPDASYHCVWEVEKELLPFTQAQATFQAPAALPAGWPVGNERPYKVGVRLLDDQKNEIGAASTTVIVSRRRQHYIVFVVDSSLRTGMSADAKTILERLKSDLSRDLTTLADGKVHAGIHVFGVAAPLGTMPCEHTLQLIPLGPVDRDQAAKAVGQLQPGQKEAPLLLALRAGVQALSALRPEDARFSLVILTGGPDNCDPGDPAAYFHKVRALLEDAKLGGLWREYKLLTVTIPMVFSAAEIKRWQGWLQPAEYGEFPHVAILPRDAAALSEVLRAVAQLSDSDAGKRRAACAFLSKFLRDTQDERSAWRIEDFCRRLGP